MQNNCLFIVPAVKDRLDQYPMVTRNYLYILLLLVFPNSHVNKNVEALMKGHFLCSLLYMQNKICYIKYKFNTLRPLILDRIKSPEPGGFYCDFYQILNGKINYSHTWIFLAHSKIGFSYLVSIKLKLMQSFNLYGVKEKSYRPILSINIYKIG